MPDIQKRLQCCLRIILTGKEKADKGFPVPVFYSNRQPVNYIPNKHYSKHIAVRFYYLWYQFRTKAIFDLANDLPGTFHIFCPKPDSCERDEVKRDKYL